MARVPTDPAQLALVPVAQPDEVMLAVAEALADGKAVRRDKAFELDLEPIESSPPRIQVALGGAAAQGDMSVAKSAFAARRKFGFDIPGLPPADVAAVSALYAERGLLMTPQTMPVYHRIAPLRDDEAVGSGWIGPVYRVTLSDGRTAAFKPIEKGDHALTELAVRAYDDLLGLKMVVPGELAVLSDAGELHFGLLMEVAEGIDMSQLEDRHLEDFDVLHAVNDMNLFDFLIDERDRINGGNFKMAMHRPRCILFDHEESLQTQSNDEPIEFPPLLTTERAAVVRDLSPSRLLPIYRIFNCVCAVESDDKGVRALGLRPDAEQRFELGCERLRTAQGRIDEMRSSGDVVPAGDWNAALARRLPSLDESLESYMGALRVIERIPAMERMRREAGLMSSS
jgi:hypothetical protein